MKKLLQLLFVMGLVLFVVGCGTNDENGDTNNNNDQVENGEQDNDDAFAGEPVIEGFITTEIRSEGTTMTYVFVSEMSEAEALEAANTWASQNGYEVVEEHLNNLISEDEGELDFDESLVNITTSDDTQDFEGNSRIEIRMYQ